MKRPRLDERLFGVELALEIRAYVAGVGENDSSPASRVGQFEFTESESSRGEEKGAEGEVVCGVSVGVRHRASLPTPWLALAESKGKREFGTSLCVQPGFSRS